MSYNGFFTDSLLIAGKKDGLARQKALIDHRKISNR